MRLTVRAKIGLLLFATLLIGGSAFVFFGWMLFKLKWWTLLVMVVIYAWFSLSVWLSRHSKGKVMKVAINVVSAPLGFLFLAIGLMQPFITIVGTYLFVALFGFGIPALILKGLDYVFGLGLLPETICFISISLGSILCANSYLVTRNIIHWSPLRNQGEHRYEGYREKLAYYLIQPENVVFLLYLTYFILLSVTGFMHMQYGVILISDVFDSAILKAFLVFIAFTNMKTKAHDSKLDFQEILKLTMGLFVHDDEYWLLNRFNRKVGSSK